MAAGTMRKRLRAGSTAAMNAGVSAPLAKVAVAPQTGAVVVTGLAARVEVRNAEAALDTLQVSGLDGTDSVTAQALPAVLIKLAGGLTRGANTQSADLTRFEVHEGKRLQGAEQPVELARALSGDAAADVPLRDGDVLIDYLAALEEHTQVAVRLLLLGD